MELLKTEKPQLTLIDGSRGDDCKPVIEGCKKNAMRCIMLNEIDVMRIAFRGNEWPKEDDFFFKKIPSTRTLCGDELELPRQNSPSEEDYGKVRETYQQLSKRFREDLNFAYSIEFDRGAFEMRRKELWKKKGLINWSTGVWLTLYKYASHYSGNLLLPVVWWVVLVILFGWFYSFTNADAHHMLGSPDGRTYWDYVLLSVRSALSLTAGTTETEGGVKISDGVHTLQAVQRTLSIVLAALFVFALRRRVKH